MTWAYILQQIIVGCVWAAMLRVVWLDWREDKPQRDVKAWFKELIWGREVR